MSQFRHYKQGHIEATILQPKYPVATTHLQPEAPMLQNRFDGPFSTHEAVERYRPALLADTCASIGHSIQRDILCGSVGSNAVMMHGGKVIQDVRNLIGRSAD